MPAPPFKVKAVFEYKSAEPDDLTFPNGQIITVTAEEDNEWYSGEYTNTAGQKVEGIFPRNFVENYEPAIPSRPVRTVKRPPPQESLETGQPSEPIPPGPASRIAQPQLVQEANIDPPKQFPDESTEVQASSPPPSSQTFESSVPPKSPPSTGSKPKPPPPVAEKPSGNSFRDRIAAFNKPAAPVTPFKTNAQPGGSAGFIKKPFVAPPPSKNAYVPPPREPPAQKIYRREEEPDIHHEQGQDISGSAESAPTTTKVTVDEDQPKPTSLKERIALLQKQQLEQAARLAEPAQKKEKPKRPPKKRLESLEDIDHGAAPPEPHLERVGTNETLSKKSVDFADDDSGPLRGPRRQPSGHGPISTPPQPSRELVSDTNDADDSGAGDTEDALETSTEEEKANTRRAVGTVRQSEDSERQASKPTADDDGEEEQAEDEEEEEEDEDPEVRRRREIRDRMAKMSGGMGMMGMFGPPGGLPGAAPPRKAKGPAGNDRQTSSQYEREDSMARAPPVPIMALPGMSNIRSTKPEAPAEPESDEEDTAQHTPQEREPDEISVEESQSTFPAPIRKSTDREEPQSNKPPLKRTSTDRSIPPVPQDRAVPPPPPREARAPPPSRPAERPIPAMPQSPQSRAPPPPPRGPENDARPSSKEGTQMPSAAPPVPSRQQPNSLHLETSPPTSPATTDKQMSRGPPPLPPMTPTSALPQARGPPPPPPGQPPTRRSTTDSHSSLTTPMHQVDDDSEDEVTEYDGDYDTDIGSSAKHKEALKSHNRDFSLDESLMSDDATTRSPTSPPARPIPPLPQSSAPRDLPPPPPPPQQAPKSRKSTDIPRTAPPPIPPTMDPYTEDNDDYDPYRYANAQHGMPSPTIRNTYSPLLQSPQEELDEGYMYDANPPITRAPPTVPTERSVPPPPSSIPAPAPLSDPPRQSTDVKRSNTQTRRSTEVPRPSGELGFIATDVDFAQSSMWWTQDNLPPPALQNRTDVLYEMESSTSTKRGGKTTISRDIYFIYMDYSQTTINVTFDPSEPSHANLEQRHERPPPPPRQDQLEDASTKFGTRVAESAAAKLNSTIGDGTAQSFILDLLRPLASQVLLPIGTRAYGALVYANLANASTQQFDEIRAGDIVTFRNAKFAGHKGGLHSKYSVDVGKPDHVGVVMDWDGTKKKIRAWEQGRDEGKQGKKEKVGLESFKVGDLKSGEVRVWRLMGRRWVGWDDGAGR